MHFGIADSKAQKQCQVLMLCVCVWVWHIFGLAAGRFYVNVLQLAATSYCPAAHLLWPAQPQSPLEANNL